MRSIAANCFLEYMSFTYGVRNLAYSPPYQRQLTMPLHMREYVSECYGRNRGLRFFSCIAECVEELVSPQTNSHFREIVGSSFASNC